MPQFPSPLTHWEETRAAGTHGKRVDGVVTVHQTFGQQGGVLSNALLKERDKDTSHGTPCVSSKRRDTPH